MERENKLIKKVKLLLKRAKAPRFLHWFGPKLYELWQHVFALFVKGSAQLSFRRTTQFLREFGFVVATKSTLQRYAAKLDLPFWQIIFQSTVGRVTKIGAIDGTGLERTSASWYYIKRIDDKKPMKQYFKLSILTGTNAKIFSLRVRSARAHDIKDVKYLFNQAKKCPSILLMDKGYDAEWLHRFFDDHHVKTIVPVRKKCGYGSFRKKLKKNFPQKLYHQRSIVESVFHALKTKYGSSVSSKKIKTARTEIYIRAILHNIFLHFINLLGHTRF